MNVKEKNHSVHGRCLFLDNGILEIGVALDFGIRICHFSFLGEENVFYEQPMNSDRFTTTDGWRLRGGHRLWIAPESDDIYAPDNVPVEYSLLPNGIEITQSKDERLHIVKQIRICFDNDRVQVNHKITYLGEGLLECALWPISVMAPGGIERIPLKKREGGFDPLHSFSLWDHSSLGDCRAKYKKDEIILTHMDIDRPYKIGIGHPNGEISYTNRGTAFLKSYDFIENAHYPDGEVSYETYLSKFMVEIESLSPLYTLRKGENAEHNEYWRLVREE